MPYAKERKQESRQKILEQAAMLFTSKGFDNTSIDEIMSAAGMTRGAFYAHFSSKSDLYRKAIVAAAQYSNLVQKKPDHLSDRTWLNRLLKGYLSVEHVNQQGGGCPLAFLATDVANKDSAVRSAYTGIYKRMNKTIADYSKSFSSCNRNEVMAITAMLIGGVAVGRTLSDEKMVEKLLASCEDVAKKLLDKI